VLNDFAILHAICPLGCTMVERISFPNHSYNVKRKKSMLKLDFQDRLDILLEMKLSGVAKRLI